MNYQEHKHLLNFFLAVGLFVFAGCGPEIQRTMRVCPGKGTVKETISILESRLENSVQLRAKGSCRARFWVEGKQHNESFHVKLWANPPSQVYLQGDIFLNPKGIVLGSNEREFWLSIKPKEISSYWWGEWSGQNDISGLVINPEMLLEALGAVEIGGEKNWTLSNEGAFDVLTKRDEEGLIVKKIHVYNCDYLVRKIEYFDGDGRAVVVMELDKYKEVSEGFRVPAVIKIISFIDGETEDSIKITLKSVKLAKLNEKVFNRPPPRGFKHIYKIVDGSVIEH